MFDLYLSHLLHLVMTMKTCSCKKTKWKADAINHRRILMERCPNWTWQLCLLEVCRWEGISKHLNPCRLGSIRK